MRDTELYQHLLGLREPWTVANVELNARERRVDVWVEHPPELSWSCAECKRSSPLYDHAEERIWRHLDSCDFKTFLHARPPRVNCPEHGVRQVRLPWADPNGRFTLVFERKAIDVLKETDVKGAGNILDLSWDEAWPIMERAVGRGQLAKEKRVLSKLSVDEKAIAKGHTYLTIVCDIDAGTVEYVGDDRKKASLDAFYQSLSPEQLNAIQAVSMDMWEPFVSSTKQHVPNATEKIVFDRFHIMQHMNDAVDQVRRQERRLLGAKEGEVLAGSKHLWLYAYENVPEKHRERFEVLKESNLRTSRAWAIKENLRELWEYRSPHWAREHWKRWYHWAMSSRLTPVKDVARMIHDHLTNVLTFVKHRITTATSEGLNAKIQNVKRRAYGFRNKQHFKTAIFFHCGGLDLYPKASG